MSINFNKFYSFTDILPLFGGYNLLDTLLSLSYKVLLYNLSLTILP